MDAYALTHPRAGMSNLLISRAQQDDTYDEKVITGHENTLSADQVRMIRAMANEGVSIESIVERSGARNISQVKRMLVGTSYARTQ